MHPINRNHFFAEIIAVIAFALMLAQSAIGSVPTSDREVWKGYSQEQKQLAIAGFADCYRSASGEKEVFALTDLVATGHLVDVALSHAEENQFGSLILQSLKNAPTVKPDVHAEHWNGPTGFHSGLWWRGIEDRDRQAYVQGVVWCAKVLNTVTISTPVLSVQQVVEKLNGWYVISDDDWSDPRSNARVDVSAIGAMQRLEILRIKRAAGKK
jgi:hypothetical protein